MIINFSLPVTEPFNEHMPQNEDGPIMQYDSPIQCKGRIEYIRFSVDTEAVHNKVITVIKLDSEKTEHYTNIYGIQRQLFEAMIRGIVVQLITDSCRDGDHGFAVFEMDFSSL